MPTAQKEKTVQRAADWYTRSVGMVFTDYRGLKVKEIQQLRSQLKAKGGELHVVKNTLFRRAVAEAIEQLPEEYHNGPTAIAFIFENETDCAKVVWDYAVSHKALTVKGGFFAGKVFDAKAVETLSKLPSREVLIAQVIGTIAAPLVNIVNVVNALYAQPIRTIYAVADKLGAEAPKPDAEKPDGEVSSEPKAEAQATAPETAAEAPAPQETISPDSTESAEAAAENADAGKEPGA